MTTLCLNMIVKNEARVIRRCLDSVRPFISSWVIVDTGSTDGTQHLIREHMAGVPGELHDRTWRNFEVNRNEALSLAQGKADYLLLIDADDYLVADPGFRMPALDADELQLRVKTGDVSYLRTMIVKASLPWRYVGATHEVIECPLSHTTALLPGLVLHTTADGSRTVEGRKHREDAALLLEALEKDPGDARAAFYLAQTYRAMGEIEEAIEAYEKRAGMGGWAEEAWYSLYQSAALRELAGQDRGTVVQAYLRAYDQRPTRAEPLCDLARYHRLRGEHAVAHVFSSKAVTIPRPSDILFVQESAYDWRSLDEYSISLFHAGKIKESLDCIHRLLSGGKLPLPERERVEGNKALCQQRLGHSGRTERNKRKRERKKR